MLVSSDRHRPEDLELWMELEGADKIYRCRKADRSLGAIKEFLANSPTYVGVSWGKDSVAVAHLVRQIDASIPLINLRCSNRNPDCDSVRDTYLSVFPSDYSEVVVDYNRLHSLNLPHAELDRQTDSIWNAAIKKISQSFSGRHILGIRADESHGRRVRCLRWGHNSRNGCAPLAWWTTADIFGYLAVNHLPVHPAYAMLGGGRWPRERIRTAEIGDTHGTGGGRAEWEREYYGDVINRLALPVP